MDIFEIDGPVQLAGTIEVAGSKNSTLPVMAAMILPGGVDLMNTFGKFAGIIPQLLIVSLLSSLLVIASSAWATQKLMRGKTKDGKGREA